MKPENRAEIMVFVEGDEVTFEGEFFGDPKSAHATLIRKTVRIMLQEVADQASSTRGSGILNDGTEVELL